MSHSFYRAGVILGEWTCSQKTVAGETVSAPELILQNGRSLSVAIARTLGLCCDPGVVS